MRWWRLILVVASGLAVGCIFRPGPVVRPPGPNPDYVLRLRLITVTAQGISPWGEVLLRDRVAQLTPAYRSAGLDFSGLDATHNLECPELMEVSGAADYRLVQAICTQQAQEHRAMPILFVGSLLGSDQQGLGGMAWFPDQYGIVIARRSLPNVVPHEVGHALGLAHVWEDPFSDTPSSGSQDCAVDRQCQIMSYCTRPVIGACEVAALSAEQAMRIREVLGMPSRAIFLERAPKELSKKLISARAGEPRIDDPIVCGFDH